MPNGSTTNGKGSQGGGSAGPAIALLVVGLLAGFVVGKMTAGAPTSPSPSPSPSARTYEEGYADAKKDLEKLSVMTPEPEELMELSGPVLEVKDSSFTMRVDTSVLNPLVKGVPEVREVRVGAKTVITTLVLKDKKTYDKEVAAYDKANGAAIAAGQTAPPMPSPYEEKTLAIADLGENDHVVVTADHDVKREASFEAVSVKVGFESNTPALPPIPEDRPPAPSDNRPPPPNGGETPTLPPPPTAQ